MREAVIVGAIRTPFGKRNGGLKEVHPVDLSADVLQALVKRAPVPLERIDDVIWGCVTQVGDQSSNIARFAVLAAGWPEFIPGLTVNRACGSSQEALDIAAAGVMSGRYDVVVAGGVEAMSRVPLGAAREVGFPYGPRVMERYDNFSFNQGLSAEAIARKWSMDRQQLDEYAVESHMRAAQADDRGEFESQLLAIATPDGLVERDECIRRESSISTLSKLKPSFVENGVIHAGNSSQISDGASAVLVTSREAATELGLGPLVRYHSSAVVGDDPKLMLTGPIAATQKLVDRSGVSLDEIGVFEVNEAFAPVPIAWQAETGVDSKRLNPQGGAIALGHPLGASGTGLMTRMVNYMIQHQIRYGLQTMCEGGGTANATLVELLAK
jgi:acetyl-CoA acyltransferase